MGLYIRLEDVRIRLLGKVRFTDDEEQAANMMHVLLANRLINEAEANVETDLSPRYAAPFQTDDGVPFKSLPLRPTQEFLRTLCELKAAIRILQTDFGRGSAVNGDSYKEDLEKQYKSMVRDHLAKKSESYQQWVQPPLPSLRLNWGNTESDDGYAGQILSTSSGDGSFPQTRINDPSKTYWNATLNDIVDVPCKPLSKLDGC